MFTFRQYRPHQKGEFIKTYPKESWAAAGLLRDDVRQLSFDFASVYHEPGGILAGVCIEFRTRTGGLAVWVEVMHGEPKKVLDQRS